MQVRVAMLFLAAGAAAAQTAAPTPQGNAGVIRVNVPDVMVPVIVTDGKGHHAALSVIRHRPNSNRGGTLLSDMDRGAATVAFQNGSAMEQAARATSGIYFHDSKRHAETVAFGAGRRARVLPAGIYVPKNTPQDGSFHGITVEVADKKLRVRAKAGYWAGAAKD